MVQSYEIKSSDSRKGSGFVDSFKALFRRNRQPESLKVPSKRSGKAPIADPEPSEPSSLVSNASSSEENNNIGGIRSSANAPESSTTTTVSVPVDANRYEIRKPPPAVKRKSSYSTTTTKSSKSGGKPVQRRKSFGRRINNLWSNFGLLRSSEKIVEFANGYAAFQHVRDNVEDLSEKSEANETDLVFLQGILQNPAVTQMIKVSRLKLLLL
nr:uncharacterized protein LOC115258720 isoform X1 [Aedes albopictus]